MTLWNALQLSRNLVRLGRQGKKREIVWGLHISFMFSLSLLLLFIVDNRKSIVMWAANTAFVPLNCNLVLPAHSIQNMFVFQKVLGVKAMDRDILSSPSYRVWSISLLPLVELLQYCVLIGGPPACWNIIMWKIMMMFLQTGGQLNPAYKYIYCKNSNLLNVFNVIF